MSGELIYVCENGCLLNWTGMAASYHYLPFVSAPPSSALSWKHLHFPADVAFCHHWVVYHGFDK